MYRRRGRDRRIRIACWGGGDGAALDDKVWLYSEKGRRPQYEISQLALLDRADVFRHAMGDRRIDGIFGDIALRPGVIVVALVLRQPAALLFHFVGGLPGADDDLADAAHGLAVRRHHGERAEVMEDILGRDGLLADAAFRERQVLGDGRIEVMAYHQ